MKVALNKDYGGFPMYEIPELQHIYKGNYTELEKRSHIDTINYFINNPCDSVQIVEIPDNSYAVINNYDGIETLYYSAMTIKSK